MMKLPHIPFISGLTCFMALTMPAQAGLFDNLFGDTLRIDMKITTVDGREYSDHGYCDMGQIKAGGDQKNPSLCLLDFAFTGQAPLPHAKNGSRDNPTLQLAVGIPKNGKEGELAFILPPFVMDTHGKPVATPNFAVHVSTTSIPRKEFEDNGAELAILYNEPLATGIKGFVRDRTRIGTVHFSARADDR